MAIDAFQIVVRDGSVLKYFLIDGEVYTLKGTNTVSKLTATQIKDWYAGSPAAIKDKELQDEKYKKYEKTSY